MHMWRALPPLPRWGEMLQAATAEWINKEVTPVMKTIRRSVALRLGWPLFAILLWAVVTTPVTAAPSSQRRATATPSCISTYTVRSGDTLSSIARRFGVTMDSIARASRLANVNLLSVGQRLTIPTCVTPEVTRSTSAVCSCSSNLYNCIDFRTRADAQACYDYCWRTVGYDVHRLDGNQDGRVCESTSASSSSGSRSSAPTLSPGRSAPSVNLGATRAVCDCSGNLYNCKDFRTHADAQACHDYCMDQVGRDIHKLDGDNDGEACESLP